MASTAADGNSKYFPENKDKLHGISNHPIF